MNPLIRPWRQIFNFAGRATRTEYGLFHISFIGAVIVVELVLGGIMAATGVSRVAPSGEPNLAVLVLSSILGILWLLFFLAFMIGHISVSVRRLHDHGDSGFKYLLTFIPLVGIIFWAMMVFTGGDEFENEYGPDPRHPVDTPEQLGGVFS